MNDDAVILAVILGGFLLYRTQQAQAYARSPQGQLQSAAGGLVKTLEQTGLSALGNVFGNGNTNGIVDPGTEAGAIPPQTGSQILSVASGSGIPVAGVNASTGDSVEEDARLAALNYNSPQSTGITDNTQYSATQYDLVNADYGGSP